MQLFYKFALKRFLIGINTETNQFNQSSLEKQCNQV